MVTKIKKLFNSYVTLGSDETSSENDLKKIKLLNLACLIWHLLTICIISEKIILKKDDNSLLIGVAIVVTVLVLFVQIFLYFKKLTTASVVFVYNIMFILFILTNYLFTGEHIEYYLVIPPIAAIILLENKKIILGVSILSICLFFIPNFYFQHYDYYTFNNMAVLIYFIPILWIINYFKNLNVKSEQKLKIKQKELEDLNQFKSQFFTNISHEIRTPLTIINGQISDLNEFTRGSTKLNSIQTSIENQVDNITSMVDNVLDLAKMQSSNFILQLKQVNVTDIIHKQFLNFEPLFNQKNICFSINKNVDAYFSQIDTLYIERALNNLIVNAFKYTNNGSVSIKIKEANNNKLFIEITDTGIGIKETQFEKVFGRFYQVNNDINKSGGSGVGLAFSREIIELHGGQILLESKLNIGSTFTIILPFIKKEILLEPKEITDLETSNAKTSYMIGGQPSKLIFLIVDDNYDMRKYLVSILSKYTCIEASNGLEALEIINRQNINFIITDYMMPLLNGYEFISRLKEKRNIIPIIMLTAKTNLDKKIGVLKLGVDDYIVKPFNKQELLIRINNCLNNYTSKRNFIVENEIERQDYDSEFIEKLKAYINKNISENLNQELISENLNMSKSSLYRKIKSNTGLSPNNLIKEIRLLKAQEIAKNKPNILLKQLALEVGFQSDSYFSKIYFERFGEKPINL